MANYLAFVIIFSVILISERNFAVDALGCRCLTNNAACWPNPSTWQAFNESVNGRLMIVRPTAAFCSGNPPNMNICSNALAQWTDSAWRSDQVGAMQSTNWENTSCTQHSENVSCTQGAVPRLAVDAVTAEHVQATIRFASNHNLRLVVKNTGHDYLGRSTAPDSLLLWLHHMKTMSFIEEYTSCTGEKISSAIRVYAGVQWGEVYSWLSTYGLIAIGGASSTVGSIGGYLQGGGHGPLTRWKGMAVDQVLEFDVVTADGQRRRVSACENGDLFWAMSGGGGGSYGIVLSAVLRTYPSPSIASALVNVYTPNEERYASFIRDFVRTMPKLSDVGYSGYFYMTDTNITIAFFAPNANFTAAAAVFNDLMKANADLQSTLNTTLYPSFYSYFSELMSSTNSGGGNVLLGSRLIPETIVRSQPDKIADVFVQTKGHIRNQSLLIGHLVAGGAMSNISVNNSVNPGWRTALLSMIFAQGWSDDTTTAEQNALAAQVRKQVELLQTIAGGAQSTCYFNEADPNEPQWQQKFFGTLEIYNRLKAIKKRFDPSGLFICKNCVGSDDWTADLNCPRQSVANQLRITTTLLFLLTIVLHWQHI